MKFLKFLMSTFIVAVVSITTFNLTYEKTSAIELLKYEEKKKKEVVFKGFINENNMITNSNKEKEDSIHPMHNKNPLKVKTNSYVFVGDSRLDAFKDILSDLNLGNIHFITSNKVNCNWLKNEGWYELNKILNNSNLSYNIIFTTGLNDLKNTERYIDFYNYAVSALKNHNIFVTDINPLNEAKSIESGLNFINNDDIYLHNIAIKKNMSKDIHFINTYQELICNGYETLDDGYLYNETTNQRLIAFILNYINSL